MYEDIIAFIHELYGSQETVPLHAPSFKGNEKKYLNECIDTTFVSSVGKFVDRFEEMMEEYTGAKKSGCLCEWYQCTAYGIALSRG